LDRIDPVKYEARLVSLGDQKWGRLEREEPVKRKQKVVNYLANKGFELDLIWKIISQLEQKGH
ncbi:MAG: RecX family transcriptional regulator, partial [Bacteroidota bacterium]